MKVWKKLFAMLFIFIISSFAFAKNIVFSCVQNLQAFEKAEEITTKVEDIVFNSLFDAGIIAGNISIVKNNNDVFSNIRAVNEMLETDCEYVLIVNLNYESEASLDIKTDKEFAQIKSINYSLFSNVQNKMLRCKKIKIKKSNTEKDMLKKICNASEPVFKTLITSMK